MGFTHIKAWKSHVKTLEIWSFDNQDLCIEFDLKFSKENNIVESNEWANLIEENSLGGVIHNEYTKNKISKSLTGRTLSKDHKLKNIKNLNRPEVTKKSTDTRKIKKLGIFNPEIQRLASAKSRLPEVIVKKQDVFKQINHQQGPKNSQYGTRWITNNTVNKKIYKTENLPLGWRYGRI